MIPSFYPELFQTRVRVTARAISQNTGTTITALLPALFAIVAPPGTVNIPFIIGAITLGITAVAALAALTARETYRVHLLDLGHLGAVRLDKPEYDRVRAESLPPSDRAFLSRLHGRGEASSPSWSAIPLHRCLGRMAVGAEGDAVAASSGQAFAEPNRRLEVIAAQATIDELPPFLLDNRAPRDLE